MADEKENAAVEQGSGKKRLIIIGAIAVVLLLSAGAAAYLLLGDDAPADGQEAPLVEQGEPVYHKLDPAFVVTLPPGGPAGMLQIAIEVMSRTPGVPATLAANDPMIRHHVLNLLEQQQAADLLTVAGKEALQAAIQALIGAKLQELQAPGTIDGVFFTQFVMQ